MGKPEATEPDNTPVSTLSNSLPRPSKSVALAVEYLAHLVDLDMGTKHGRTALYWHLICVVQQHAGYGVGADHGPLR